MEYQPIENYGIIGDLNTVALVGINGSIDFMCYPDFDSPSIFAAMLDKHRGGHFEITPLHERIKHKQMYLPDTNVLMTRFLMPDGVGEVTDFMPIASEDDVENVLVRRVTTVRGEITYRMHCHPRFNYGRSKHKTTKSEKSLLFQSDDGLTLRLSSSVPLEIKSEDGFAEFTLKSGEKADFILEEADGSPSTRQDFEGYVTNHLFRTLRYWKAWIARSKYRGRWLEMVNRSALVLKLMTSKKYGSIIAAATFGLPEQIGGDKNWDYRYTWIRDAAFTVYAFIRLGYTKEASAFMEWVEGRCAGLGPNNRLNLMYGIDGRVELTEFELKHFEGYKASKPVRIGNAAYEQLQLDITGELMDSVYLCDKYGDPISNDFWNDLVHQINWLCENWQKSGQGIWEVRGGGHHFLYSRLMSWVAVDRGIRLANKRSFPMPSHWLKHRDEMYNSIFTDFWDDKRKCFVQGQTLKRLDAATLLMPLVRFISPQDPRWTTTLKAIEEDLVSDSLVYRYLETPGATKMVNEEGTFSICTFWYVENLSRAGHLEKARYYLEKMLGYANHLGLYAEELGVQGDHLGNFPQAFTHLGLISAAYNLDRQLDDSRNRDKGFQ